ncbi:hypothetical protein BSFA1_86350 (plasmid) [Burkholderia sp. SFA1]|nr:hypothetical protein BSFA1_86350 [Burkholderia sp. SFA1]
MVGVRIQSVESVDVICAIAVWKIAGEAANLEHYDGSPRSDATLVPTFAGLF